MTEYIIIFALGFLCCHYWYKIWPFLQKKLFNLESRLDRKKKK